MSRQLHSFTLAFLLFLLIVPLFEAFEPLNDLEKLEEKFGLKKPTNGSVRDEDTSITLTSDGPVTFDATISFKAEVFAPLKMPPFYYSWSKYFPVFLS